VHKTRDIFRDMNRAPRKQPRSPFGAKEILGRIDQRITELKIEFPKEAWSDRAISKRAAGGTSSYILTSIRKGVKAGAQQGVSTQTLRKLAPALRTTVEWLLGSDDNADRDFDLDDMDHIESGAILPVDADTAIKTVPLIGFVVAGAEAKSIPLPDEDLDRIRAPANATDATRALEIRGTSLGELFDRWIVFFDDVRRPVTENLIGKLCVVGLADGRIVVKKLKRRSEGSYELLSNTEPPMTDVVVEWAAQVKHMEPK
jgi:hypothetical protein